MPRAKPPTVTVTLPELIALAKSINDERVAALESRISALETLNVPASQRQEAL